MPNPERRFFRNQMEHMMSQQMKKEKETRPFARVAAREMSPEEVDTIAGGLRPIGGGHHTHATGANGDDPGDPGDLY